MIIPVGYAQVNMRYTGVACPSGAEWTMGFDIGGFAGTAADLAEAAVEAYNAGDLAQFHTTECTFSEAYVKFGPSATGDSGLFGSITPGTASAPTTPPAVTQIVRKETAAGGRSGRGRLYFPGLPEAQISGGGLLSDAWKNNLPVAIADWVATLALAGADPVVLHSSGAPITTPTPITAFTSPARVGTQRRRNRDG
jgi:hypothetical protein